MKLALLTIQRLFLLLLYVHLAVSTSLQLCRNTSSILWQNRTACETGLEAMKEKLRREGGFPIPSDGLHTGVVEGGADSGLFTYLGQLSRDELVRVGNDGVSGTVCETGFNYGLSSYAFLCSTQGEVFSWDLGSHVYVSKAQELVNADFPERHHLILGDSRQTLLETVAAHGNGPLEKRQCDFVYVDGGHSQAVASSDIECFGKLAPPGALIVVDDCHHGGTGMIQGVTTAFDLAVVAGKILPERPMARTFTGGRSVCVGRFPKTPTFLQRRR